MIEGQQLLLPCEEQGLRAQIRALLESHRTQAPGDFDEALFRADILDCTDNVLSFIRKLSSPSSADESASIELQHDPVSRVELNPKPALQLEMDNFESSNLSASHVVDIPSTGLGATVLTSLQTVPQVSPEDAGGNSTPETTQTFACDDDDSSMDLSDAGVASLPQVATSASPRSLGEHSIVPHRRSPCDSEILQVVNPICSLPPNVLATILGHLVPCLSHLVVATHVCQAWRNLALRNQNIWSVVTISSRQPHMLQHLSAILARSGNRLLDIDLTLSPHVPQPHTPLIDLQRNMKRLRVVVLRADSSIKVGSQIQSTFSIAAPALERLELRCPCPISIPSNIFGGNAPRLRYLGLHMRNAFADQVEFAGCAGLREITTLEAFDNINQVNSPLNGRYTRLLLQHLPKLESLSLGSCICPPTVDPTIAGKYPMKPLRSLEFQVPLSARAPVDLALHTLHLFDHSKVKRIVVHDAPARVITDLMHQVGGREIYQLVLLFTPRKSLVNIAWRDALGFERILAYSQMPLHILADICDPNSSLGRDFPIRSLTHFTVTEYVPSADVPQVRTILERSCVRDFTIVVGEGRRWRQGDNIMRSLLEPNTLGRLAVRCMNMQRIILARRSGVATLDSQEEKTPCPPPLPVGGLVEWLRAVFGYGAAGRKLVTLAVRGLELVGRQAALDAVASRTEHNV